MKHNLPKTCPVCGAKESGGANTVKWYVCGGHVWVSDIGIASTYELHGHCNGDYNKESEVEK